MRSPSEDPPREDPEATGLVQPTSSFHAGDVLCGRFRVERFIARGGMGELYAARDLTLGETVAVKTIRPEIAPRARVHQRFLREVQLARKVTHPGICRIFDLFQHESSDGAASAAVSFVTMELLNGETLAERLRRDGRMSVERALPIVTQMVAALSAAHAAGVVHRDFKSNNVMLLEGASKDTPRVVVTDFGLAYSASHTGPNHADPVSVAGEVLGTPGYMAPEQVAGGTVTPATDVYALGAVLYEMLTGSTPFSAESRMAAVVHGPDPTPPRLLAAEVPPAWNDTILKCLARSPVDRFARVDDVLHALGARRAGLRSRRALVAAVAGVVVVLAVAAAFVPWRVWNAQPPAAAVPAVVSGQTMRRSVAVLGFRNLAGREDTAWLSTALAEMLSAELAAGDALRSIPGETVHRMKTDLALADADSYAAETLARIRQNIGSDLVVSGSYVAVGGGDEIELRVDIRLQDSHGGETIAVITQTGRSAALFDLVSRTGAELRGRIGVERNPAMTSLRASVPSSPEAARLYTEGLNELRRLNALGARELLERAIEVDADFPLAHSALAATWASLGYDNRAREEAERALALSAGLSRAERLQVEATYREMSSSWTDAVALWQTLATFFPDDIEHALRLSNAQLRAGTPREALRTIEEFRMRFPQLTDPRLDLTEAQAAETLSDFARVRTAAAAAAARGAAQGARRLVADARLLEGGSLIRQGFAPEALPLLEQARVTYEETGDRGGVARTLNSQGVAHQDGPDWARAVRYYEEGLEIARAIGQQDLVARFLNNLAIAKRRAGDRDASLAMNQESLRIRREIGDRANAAVSLNNIGNVLLDMGDFDGASRNYEESAETSREIGDRSGLSRALRNAAEAFLMQGQIARARSLNEEALAIRRSINDPTGIASSLDAVAATLTAAGRLDDAKKALAESLEIARRINNPRGVAYALYDRGEIALLEGELGEARRLHEEALAIRQPLGEPMQAADSRLALAVLALEEAKPQDAETAAREAADALAGVADSAGEARARTVVALALLAQNRVDDAEREIARAQSLGYSRQHAATRLTVAIAAARVGARSDAAAAVQALEAARTDAADLKLVRFVLEARVALVEIEEARAPATAAAARESLRRDAIAGGLLLYAR